MEVQPGDAKVEGDELAATAGEHPLILHLSSTHPLFLPSRNSLRYFPSDDSVVWRVHLIPQAAHMRKSAFSPFPPPDLLPLHPGHLPGSLWAQTIAVYCLYRTPHLLEGWESLEDGYRLHKVSSVSLYCCPPPWLPGRAQLRI